MNKASIENLIKQNDELRAKLVERNKELQRLGSCSSSSSQLSSRDKSPIAPRSPKVDAEDKIEQFLAKAQEVLKEKSLMSFNKILIHLEDFMKAHA